MSDVGRSIKEGISFGLIAGSVFALAQLIAAMIAGVPAALPFRMAASVVLGYEAVVTRPIEIALPIGLFAHLGIAAWSGLLYGIYNSALTAPTRRGRGRQAIVGILYGGMVWLITFQVVARAYFPWFLDVPQLPQALLHAMAFGLPLGLLYGTAERRVPMTREAYGYP